MTIDKKQPSFDEPLAINLTPNEIWGACGVGHQMGMTAYNSRIAEFEDFDSIPWQHDAVNERTGYSCQIAVVEYSDEDGEIVVEYVVELVIDNDFVIFSWRADGSGSDMEVAKRNAHQTYINVCALIGVKVGYHLVTDPSPY